MTETLPRPELQQVKGDDRPHISRWEATAKTVLIEYLQSCLKGARKAFFSRFAPYAEHWVIRSDVAWNAQNPLDVAVQISRFYEDVSQAIPQIFVRTTGHTASPSSLGTFAMGESLGSGQQRVAIIDNYVVPVEMALAAADPDNCEYLVDFVETALGPKSRFVHNYLLVSSTHKDSCVYLPIDWSVGQITDVPIGDDRKSRIWTNTMTYELRVELGVWVQYETRVQASLIKTASTTLTIPDTLRVGTTAPLSISGYVPGAVAWRVSDYRVAVITAGRTLYTKRPGSVTLTLYKLEDNSTVAEKNITVIP